MSDKKFPAYEPLDDQLRMLKSDIRPDNALKSAVVGAQASTVIIPARVHVKQTAKAVLLYAACIALFLGAIMLLPRLFSQQTPVGTEEPAVTTMPWDDPSLSEEERKVRKAADPIVMELYGITNLSNFSITINSRKPFYDVVYKISFGGYVTEETVKIELNADLTVASTETDYFTLYSRYLPNATQEIIQNAKNNLIEKIKAKTDQSGVIYLEIDENDYLCFKSEVIVPRAPDDPDKSGCGDHDHLFFTERICAPGITYERDTLKNPEQYTDVEQEIIRLIWIDKKRDAIQLFPETTINDIANQLKSEFFYPVGDGYLFMDYSFWKTPTSDRIFTRTVNQYEFRLLANNDLKYYHDGRLYYIGNGLINYYHFFTEEELQPAWEAYKEFYPDFYAEENLNSR